MFRTQEQLEAGLAHIRQSPRTEGRLEAIVIRPERDQRRELESASLDLGNGLPGDRWVKAFPSPPLPGLGERNNQLTLMNSRAAQLVAGTRERWALAGDQLFVDFDLSEDHLRVGDRLRIGEAVVEMTAQPHLGCRKFAARFGEPAMSFVNSTVGRHLHLRGVCAKVIEPGTVRVGDAVRKVTAPAA